MSIGIFFSSLSTQTEKLIAEFCMVFIFTFTSEKVLNIPLKLSSTMNEKSFGEIESKTWFILKIKQGIGSGDCRSFITVPFSSGCRKDFTYSGIFLFCSGLMVFG